MQAIVSLGGHGVALAQRSQYNLRRTGVIYRPFAEMRADRRDGAGSAHGRRTADLALRPDQPFNR